MHEQAYVSDNNNNNESNYSSLQVTISNNNNNEKRNRIIKSKGDIILQKPLNMKYNNNRGDISEII